MSLNKKQRSQQARAAAFVMHSKHDARDTTAKARSTFLSSFEKQVDPDGTLEPAERERRATAARKAHFTALSLASSKARQARKQRS